MNKQTRHERGALRCGTRRRRRAGGSERGARGARAARAGDSREAGPAQEGQPGGGASERRRRETRSCPHRWCAPTAESPVPVPLAGEDRFLRWTSVAMPAPLSATTGLSLRNGIPKQRSRTNGLRCPLPHAGPCPWPGLRRLCPSHTFYVCKRVHAGTVPRRGRCRRARRVPGT